MMLTLEFEVPYTRSQVRTALANRGDFLPSAASTMVTSTGEHIDIDDTSIDPEEDLISVITVDGFSSIDELATFLGSFPAAIDTRLSALYYT